MPPPSTDPLAVFAPDLFRDRVALVTGGGRGLGRAIALGFARLGAKLVLASRDPKNLEPTRREIEDGGGACLAVPTNIREVSEVERLVAAATERFGAIDFLVNNAGGQFPARPTEISDRGWRSVVDLNLNGTWNMCNRVGRAMVERGTGAIVNIVHIYSFDRGAPAFAHSGAARAGVVNLTRTLAYHWAHRGVTVNALAPGTCSTHGLREHEIAYAELDDYEQRTIADIPTHRLGEADEVAAITMFLCSPAARYINGAAIVADGAYYFARWTDMHDPEAIT